MCSVRMRVISHHIHVVFAMQDYFIHDLLKDDYKDRRLGQPKLYLLRTYRRFEIEIEIEIYPYGSRTGMEARLL